jgi:hypothetical protein
MFDKKFKAKNEPELRAYLARLVAALAAVKTRVARNGELERLQGELTTGTQSKADALDAASIKALSEKREHLRAVTEELESDPGTEENQLRSVVREFEEPYRGALIEPYSKAVGDVADDLERMCESRDQALQIAKNHIPLCRKYQFILTYGGLLATRDDVVSAAEEGIGKLEAILAGKNPFPETMTKPN